MRTSVAIKEVTRPITASLDSAKDFKQVSPGKANEVEKDSGQLNERGIAGRKVVADWLTVLGYPDESGDALRRHAMAATFLPPRTGGRWRFCFGQAGRPCASSAEIRIYPAPSRRFVLPKS